MIDAQSVTLTHDPQQFQRIVVALKEIFSHLLKIDPQDIDEEMSFLDMGAESLILMQASQAINDRLAIKVSFRALIEEWPSINALAYFLMQELEGSEVLNDAPTAAPIEASAAPVPSAVQIASVPAEPAPLPAAPMVAFTPPPAAAPVAPPAVAPVAPVAAAPAVSASQGERPVASSGIEQIIAQQIQLMAQQLEVLRGRPARAIPATVAPQVPSPPAALPSAVLPTPHAPAVVQSNGNGHHGPVATLPPAPVPAPAAQAAPSNPPPVAIAAPSQADSAKEQRFKTKVYVPYQPLHRSPTSGLSERQQQHLAELAARLNAKTKGSKELTQNYRKALADNRASAGFRQVWKEIFYPLISERASGSRIWDVDGNEYLDISMGFGALLYGHTPSFIMTALQDQLTRGLQLGPQSNMAGKAAALLCEITGMERAAFCNSGTEAVMIALRLARTVTGRSKIAMFAGSYHGTSDGVLLRGEPTGVSGHLRATPVAPGIPAYLADNTLVLEYCNPESLKILREHAHELAAVLVEPLQSRQPDTDPQPFLKELRQLTSETGMALIFDEVITGFRMHARGMQGVYGIQADIATYGKALGGGVPVGAVAGKALYMDAIDGGIWNYGDTSYPRAEMTYVAGTYFKHPLAMAAVWESLNQIKANSPQLQDQLTQRTRTMVETLNAYFEEHDAPLRLVHFGSLFRFVFAPEVKFSDLFFYHLIDKGVYVWEGRNCYLSTAHTDADIDHLIRAVKESVAALQDGEFMSGSSGGPKDSGPQGGADRSPNNGRVSGPVASPNTGNPDAHPPTHPQTPSDQAALRLPLTEAQKQLWVQANLSSAANRAYNEPLQLRINGALDVAALHKALLQVINRHDALRTTFSPQGDYQQIAPSLSIEIPLTDLSAHNPEEREQHLMALLNAEVQQPFDLVQGPLLRCRLFKVAEQTHVLALTIHHLINDGWSNTVILRELMMIYAAAIEGASAELPPPMQYREFVAWKEQQRQSPAIAAAETYWQREFAEPVPVLELPTDNKRPTVQSYNGAQESLTLGQPLYTNLKRMSIKQRSTLFVTMLACYQLLIHRLSGQNDIVVGIPTAEQAAIGGENLVGYGVNLLPLRSSFDPTLSFADYLTKVRRTLLNAQEHAIYPFDQLVKQLDLPRDPGRAPLVNITFNLERGGNISAGDLVVQLLPPPTPCVKFELFLNITDNDNALRLDCAYNSDLFARQTIQRWLGHFVALVEAVVANPQQPMALIPLLTRGEQEQMLLEWNATDTAYPSDTSVHRLFEAQVAETPDATALVFDEQRMSYTELNQRANHLAHYLRGLGLHIEQRVGICLERSPEMVVAMLAVLKAGGCYVPLDPTYPADRLAYMLNDADVTLLLTRQAQVAQLPDHSARVICLDADWAQIAQASATNPDSVTWPQNLAYVMYTSGSTGKPKGIGIPHQAIVRLVRNTNYVQIGPDDRIAHVSNVSFDAATFEIWGALLNGAQVIGIPRDVTLVPQDFAAYLRDYQISAMFLTTALFNQLVREVPDVFATLRHMLFGGEACNPAMVRQLLAGQAPERLLHVYGPTESTTFATWYLITQVAEDATTIPIGRPLANTQTYVLDAQLQPVPVGIPGELYLGGDGLARGYFNRPDLTAKRFIPSPFSGTPGARLYKTGDLVRYLPNGSIEFLGRNDDQVKIRGFRIELGEIEAALKQHPAIHACLVMARQDTPGEKRLVAYVVPTNGSSPADSAAAALHPASVNTELRTFLKDRLPDYMIPATFIVLPEFPLNQNGKVDRKALPLPSEERPALEQSFVAPQTALERQLISLWTEFLPVSQIGIHDNFFELGGDSIVAIQIAAKAMQSNIRFTPAQLFQNPTVAELAQILDAPSSSKAEQEIVTGAVPLTPVQHWFFAQNLPELQHFNQAFLLTFEKAVVPNLMEQAIQCLIEHHDALRLQFVRDGTRWRQFNAGSEATATLLRYDLSGQSAEEQEQTIMRLAADLQSSLNLSTGPIVRTALFQTGAVGRDRLLFTVHHLAVDFVSWRFLLHDLWMAYEQLVQGEVVQLPPRTTSFKHWAEQQLIAAQSAQLRREVDHWLNIVRQNVPRLPVDYPSGINSRDTATIFTISLSSEETRKLLQDVPKAYQTQINDVLLTALVQSLAAWIGTPLLQVDLEGHGREPIVDNVNLVRTVGWFTCIYPVLLDLRGVEGIEAALATTKQQLRAIPNGGIGYGMLRYLCEDGAISQQMQAVPHSEICFNYLGQFDNSFSGASDFDAAPLPVSMVQSTKGMRSHLLEINGLVTNQQLHMVWSYSEHIHSRATIEQLAQQCIAALQAIIAHCQTAKSASLTAKQFPQARLSQQDLDTFIRKIGQSKQSSRS